MVSLLNAFPGTIRDDGHDSNNQEFRRTTLLPGCPPKETMLQTRLVTDYNLCYK